MSYAQIDTSARLNRKLVNLTGDAFRLWVHGLLYAQEFKTDGFIPADDIEMLGRPKARPEWVMELVAGRLWINVVDGYQVHQYTEWNATKAEREQKAQQNRDRVGRFRTRERASRTIDARAVQASLPEPQPPLKAQPSPRGNGAIIRPQVAVEKTMANVGYMGTRFRVPLHLHQELIGRYGGSPQDAEKALYRWYGELDDNLDRDASIPNIYTFINGHFADWVKARAASIPAAPAVVKQDDQRIGITPDHAAQIDAAMKRKQQGH